MLPFLLAGAVIACGGFGLKKGADGVVDTNRAKKVERESTIRLTVSRDRLDQAVRRGEAAFKTLDRQRELARDLLMEAVASTLRRVAGVDEQGFAEMEEALAEPDRLAVVLATSPSAVLAGAGGVYSGFSAGAALGAAAQSGVMSLGVASTGASISGLSGAAATNATLAWFGGGSLASGGFGMAGGAMVLSGVAAAPAVMLGGLAYARAAQRRLTSAAAFAADVDIAIEEGKSAISRTKAVTRRITEVSRAVVEVSNRVSTMVDYIDRAIDWEAPDGRGFAALSSRLQNEILLLSVLAGLLGDLVQVEIVDEVACLLDDSGAVLDRWKVMREKPI